MGIIRVITRTRITERVQISDCTVISHGGQRTESPGHGRGRREEAVIKAGPAQRIIWVDLYNSSK